MHIKLETDAGDSLQEVAKTMCRMSNLLGCEVWSKFNGTNLYCHPRISTPENILASYERARK